MSDLSIFVNIVDNILSEEGESKIKLHTLAIKTLAGLDLSEDARKAIVERLNFMVMTMKKHPARQSAHDQIIDIITGGKP